MQSALLLGLAEAPRADNVVSALARRARTHGDTTALCELRVGGAAADARLSWADWLRDALYFAAALIDAGCEPADRIAILSGNTLIWPVADLGVLAAGCVSVGVFPSSARRQLEHIMNDCGARLLVVDGAEQAAKAAGLRLPVVAAGTAGGVSWSAWLARGQAALENESVQVELRRRIASIASNSTAILIYTSGSTGEPKAAALTHACIAASAESIAQVLRLTDADSALSFLPFSHAGERLFGHYTRIYYGMSAALVADHTKLFDVARAFGPTVFGGLPRFFEKAYEFMRSRSERSAPSERVRIESARQLGLEIARCRRRGHVPPPALLQSWRAEAEREIAELQHFFGGRVRIATSGGATLPAEVAEYLNAFGFTVLGAYGLTEHLCAVMNRPERYRFDAAGLPMPGTELRIAGDGEILIRRSALTFSGYFNRPLETAASFTEDGEWLLTGDLGVVDSDGMLRITGRKKELIALSTGKKVAPLPIEARFSADPLISHVVLCGEGRKYLTALVAVRRDALESWAAQRLLTGTYTDLVNSQPVRAHVQRALDRVNADLSGPERVRKFHVLPHDLSVESGALTTTHKVRRSTVIEHYRAEIDALYAGESA